MSIARASLAVLIVLAAPGALAVTLGDRIEAECQFVNTGKISSDVTVTVDCRKALEELAPLLEDLSEATEERVRLSRELGATEAMLQMALGLLGEKNVPPEDRAERLVETIQQQKKTIRSLRSEVRSVDPNLDQLRTAAADAIEAGQPAKADSLLAELEEKEEGLKLEERLLAAAGTKIERGRIALSELRYLDAAEHFDGAANIVPRSFEDIYSLYRERAADALYRQADALVEYPDEEDQSDALRQAIDLYDRALQIYDHLLYSDAIDRTLYDFSMLSKEVGDRLQISGRRFGAGNVLDGLGKALSILGERENNVEMLRQAIAAYEDALEIRTKEDMPFEWAETKNNLGDVLQFLGERENGTERLEQSVEAYRAALQVWTRMSPFDWARVQAALGNTLHTLGERENDTRYVEQAVEAYRAALEEFTRERVPSTWAMIQRSVGTALAALGVRESGTERLEQAVDAYQAALQETTRDRVPLDWARTQMNLGNALLILGARRQARMELEAALTSMRDAADIFLNEAGQSQYEGYFRGRIEAIEASLDELNSE